MVLLKGFLKKFLGFTNFILFFLKDFAKADNVELPFLHQEIEKTQCTQIFETSDKP